MSEKEFKDYEPVPSPKEEEERIVELLQTLTVEEIGESRDQMGLGLAGFASELISNTSGSY